jgi:hypothetical protein
MTNIGYYDVGLFLGNLWLLVHAVRNIRNSRDWRHRAQALLGAVGVSYGVLSILEPKHLRATREARVLYSTQGLLVGAFIGMFISLCMAGWFKDILGRHGDKRGTATPATKPER